MAALTITAALTGVGAAAGIATGSVPARTTADHPSLPTLPGETTPPDIDTANCHRSGDGWVCTWPWIWPTTPWIWPS